MPPPLDLAALEAALPELAAGVSGFAVCAYFAVRNPAHEIAARELIREKTGLPVTASHELSAKLGGPRRALTTLLNARLISMIDRLVAATEGFLEQRGIAAPLMVVRGDGALVSAAFARQRPIETILSGPAASLVGARHMTGLDEAVVSDIGGTTTDVAVLDNGRPRLDPEGATVGGFRTMVEAVAMRTFGLGGDSEVALEDGGLAPRILLGPRRVVPLALAAFSHGDVVIAELERQLRNPNPGRMDGRFAFRTGVPERLAAGLSGPEAKLYAAITEAPQPLDRLLASTAQNATLAPAGVARAGACRRLHAVRRRPCAGQAGQLERGRRAARRRAVRPQARRPRPADGAVARGDLGAGAHRADPLFGRSHPGDRLRRGRARRRRDRRACAGAARRRRACGHRPAVRRARPAGDRPRRLGAAALCGAAAAGRQPLRRARAYRRRQRARRRRRPGPGHAPRRWSASPRRACSALAAGETMQDFTDEAAALDAAEARVRATVAERALAAGTDTAEIEVERDVRTATVEGQRSFIEARIVCGGGRAGRGSRC